MKSVMAFFIIVCGLALNGVEANVVGSEGWGKNMKDDKIFQLKAENNQETSDNDYKIPY